MAWPHWNEMLYGDARGESRREVWNWWFARWGRYNLLVGIVGFITWWLVMIAGSAAVKPGVDFEEPLAMIFGPFIYAIMANICYTFGPIFDWIIGCKKPTRVLFVLGLFFSMGITALPGIFAVLAWLMTVITGNKLD